MYKRKSFDEQSEDAQVLMYKILYTDYSQDCVNGSLSYPTKEKFLFHQNYIISEMKISILELFKN
jgi:hypothetical protein